jgi:hypothetical protein
VTVTSAFDRLVESYRGRGLSAEAALRAAIGRDHGSEAEARAASDHSASLLAAEQAASAVSLAESRRKYEKKLREVGGDPGGAAMVVAEIASARLGIDIAESRQYAMRLLERELARRGYGPTLTWMLRLGEALNAREAA